MSLELPDGVVACSCERCEHFQRAYEDLCWLSQETVSDSNNDRNGLCNARGSVKEAWRNSQRVSCQLPESEPNGSPSLPTSPLPQHVASSTDNDEEGFIGEGRRHGYGCGCNQCYLSEPPKESRYVEDTGFGDGCDCAVCRRLAEDTDNASGEDEGDFGQDTIPPKRKLYDGVQAKTSTQGTLDPGHIDNGGAHNKFMVCDHCKAHGLPCNEASVCDQCRLFNQPCVHRWCRTSPASKENCENMNCRYAHRDAVAKHSTELGWIILPGKLPEYWSKTRIKSRTFEECPELMTTSSLLVELGKKQEAAVGELRAKIAAGDGSLYRLNFDCTCRFGYGSAEQEPRVIVSSEESLDIQPVVTHFTGQLAYLNDFLPRGSVPDEETGGESGDSSEDEVTSSDEQHDDDNRVDSRITACARHGCRDDYWSVAPCNHYMCVTCALELRRDEDDQDCPQCGRHAEYVIFTADEPKRFEEYGDPESLADTDDEIGIGYESTAVQKYKLWLESPLYKTEIDVLRKEDN